MRAIRRLALAALFSAMLAPAALPQVKHIEMRVEGMT